MFKFPKDLYTDVRIEESFNTLIKYKKDVVQEIKVRKNKGAFIRIYDGVKWYYSSLTELGKVQEAIESLASMATPKNDIDENSIVKAFEVNKDNLIQFEEKSVTDVALADKQELLESLIKHIDDPTVVNYYSTYVDEKIIKEIYSSKGTNIKFDKQTCGIRIYVDLVAGEEKGSAFLTRGKIFFDDLQGLGAVLDEEMKESVAFVKNAKPVEAGTYTVLLSPQAAGVFTHESFGHKSEADFMVGDEAMKEEWKLGMRLGKNFLTIIDDGTVEGNGYTPYDDEGTKGRKNYIIKDGLLTGRLHSGETGAILEESVTGNARAINFEFEPIVRMTTTYIEKGDRPLQDIIGEMTNGIYVKTINHGSGMSTFTIAPDKAYKIENGKITDPVKISVVTGNVFEALDEVDAISAEFELLSFVGGGCGKMEQYPLPVGFGGPYTRVKNLKVQ